MQSKTHVLFVDDEVNVLNGLRRMLRSMRGEWEMTFKSAGSEALEHMASTPVDVIVSDMRMPEMDGAALLTEVRDRHPGTIRIVLSGYAKNESVLRTIGPSHQYLAKPCDADVLVRSVKRSLKLRDILDSAPLREFVTGLQSLPTPPQAFTDFMEEVNKPNATTESIAATVEQDIGLSAEVLKLTNSAYFAIPSAITSCRQAVQLLGLDTMRALVAVAGFFRRFSKDGDLDAAERLSSRSLGISSVARTIAAAEGLDEQAIEFAGCAGLLAHVGSLVLLAHSPGEYKFIGDLADEEGAPITHTEKRMFGASHAEIGAYLLGLWGFPHAVVEAVSAHHSPGEFDTDAFGVCTAVHIAQAFARVLDHPDTEDVLPAVLEALDFKHLQRLGKTERIDTWLTLTQEIAEKGDGS